MRYWLSFLSIVLAAGFSGAETWTQTATPAAWNVPGNWLPASFPNATDAAAVINTPVVAQTINLTQAITVGSINFTNNAALIQTLANGGGTLTFDVTAGNASVVVGGTSATTNNVTISATTTLNDTLQFTNNNVAGTGTATATMTGAVTGVGGFIKDGPGRFSFSTVAKAYTGPTSINQGRLRMTLTGSMTGTSSIGVASGGSLFLDQANGAWALGAGAGMALITINGDGDNGGGTNTQGALRNAGSGASTLANPVTMGSNATIHVEISTASLQLNGGLSGNSVLTKSGFGNLILPTTNAGLIGGTTITNGTITVNLNSNIGTGNLTMNQVASANATLTLNNAAQTVSNLSSVFTDVAGTFAHTINLNGTALTVNQTANTTYGTGAVGTLTSTIAGAGSVALSNTSTATLNLTGANTYGGGTAVNGGTLRVNNTTGSGTGTGAVTVGGGTLGGSGIISGAVTVNSGTLAPGNSPGILTLGSGITFTAGTFAVELQGLTPGTQYDQLLVTSGNVALGAGVATLSLAISGYTPALSDSFVVINNTGAGTLTGTFAGFPDQSVVAANVLGSGIDYLIYYGTFSGFPTSVVIAPVPEPATVLALCAAGAGAVGLIRRRLKKGKTTELAA